MATNITEQEARQVAEEAREREWTLPSFGKELFLGNLRLDLIHPQPQLDPAAAEKGERFLAALREFLVTNVDPLRIERESKIPDEVVDGLKELGALGMKVPEQYGGLGLSQVYYNRALVLAGTWPSPTSAPTRRAWRPRRRRRRAATSSTAASCGRPMARSPTSSSSWPRSPGATATAAASAPSCCRATPTASRSRTATRSWGCAASRTPRRCSRTSSCPPRTSSGARATA